MSSAEQQGEAPTLRPGEHHVLVRIAVDVARGRVPVIAGAGSNSTAHAIELTEDAEAGGADATLSVVPYYNKPIQSGLYAHFRAIAQSTGLPVILYDVPSRTACGLADETIARLAELPQIIGLKDATGDVTRLSRLRSLVGLEIHGCFPAMTPPPWPSSRKAAMAAFPLLPTLRLACAEICFWPPGRGQITNAQRWAVQIAKLTAALFRETSPAPLKYALSLLGLMSAKVRLPLVELTDQTKAELAGILAQVYDGYSEYMIGKICGSAHSSRRALAG